ncbi:hypothetical protein [Aurantimonas sp. 22II-16-19i]|uniref:hypothetical protein n=1 Tax=Aurantimonas sp. 22II-16-19i TaxID=1317114 RepID=UPI0009F7FE33|nr:hypothetical protein [Aurantimonas sp. 22II-16-19i]ORE90971.1 hypothetical protein ATO4_19954 [Aurantimonas sp. 22II-16-19i]
MRAATRCRSFAVMDTAALTLALRGSLRSHLRMRVIGDAAPGQSCRRRHSPLILSLSKGEGPRDAANDTRPGLRLRRVVRALRPCHNGEHQPRQPGTNAMVPQNPAEMRSLLLMHALTRLYSDVTIAARRGRLTEHDIRGIEAKVIEMLRKAPDFADEFQTFEVEPVIAQVRSEITLFCDISREGRVLKIGEKGGKGR